MVVPVKKPCRRPLEDTLDLRQLLVGDPLAAFDRRNGPLRHPQEVSELTLGHSIRLMACLPHSLTDLFRVERFPFPNHVHLPSIVVVNLNDTRKGDSPQGPEG